MNAPGEKLLIKLWETMDRAGVGILGPWQARRMGVALTKVRANDLVVLSDAEREAHEIRAGRLSVTQSRYAIRAQDDKRRANPARIEPALEATARIEAITGFVIGDAMRKQVNVERAIGFAEQELTDDASPVPEKEIDPDWLSRWRSCAGEISSEQLQGIWGRLLAGELKEPGTCSYRTLDFVKNLSIEEATLVQSLLRFAFSAGFIARGASESLASEGLTFAKLLELEEMGVIIGVSSNTLEVPLASDVEGAFVKNVVLQERVLVVRHADVNFKLKLRAYPLTAIGRQVRKLGKFQASDAYLKEVASTLQKQGATVGLADAMRDVPGTFRVVNERPI